MLKTLDLCFIEENNRFSYYLKAINLRVHVVAYETHANRANQMITNSDFLTKTHTKPSADANATSKTNNNSNSFN